LPRQVVRIGAAELREHRTTAADLEPRRAQQQGMQFGDRGVSFSAQANKGTPDKVPALG
jgi:hypothetical protein